METIFPRHIPANSESTQIKSKIPQYAKDLKKEWVCIIGINKNFEKFVKNILKMVLRFLFLDLVTDICLT